MPLTNWIRTTPISHEYFGISRASQEPWRICRPSEVDFSVLRHPFNSVLSTSQSALDSPLATTRTIVKRSGWNLVAQDKKKLTQYKHFAAPMQYIRLFASYQARQVKVPSSRGSLCNKSFDIMERGQSVRGHQLCWRARCAGHRGGRSV
mmetsp:Transcript_28167/g.74363  ORF Transcript_28167/g.74363 Transcript_28167/m.74363 type:complete len:149 (-) Transcript_28167:328-774(-)